jgi:hypothetical protein
MSLFPLGLECEPASYGKFMFHMTNHCYQSTLMSHATVTISHSEEHSWYTVLIHQTPNTTMVL